MVHGTLWDEEMATFACAAGPVSRAVGMGLGVESSRLGLGGFPVVFWFLLRVSVGSRLGRNIAHMFGWVKGSQGLGNPHPLDPPLP